MGAVTKEIGIKFCKFLVAQGLAWLAWKGIKNKMNGKTVFGNKAVQKEKTYVDWKGNVILGNQDGWVA